MIRREQRRVASPEIVPLAAISNSTDQAAEPPDFIRLWHDVALVLPFFNIFADFTHAGAAKQHMAHFLVRRSPRKSGLSGIPYGARSVLCAAKDVADRSQLTLIESRFGAALEA